MKWIEIGFKVLPYVIGAVSSVERFVKGSGKEKQDAAVTMVETFIEAAEGVAGKDLLNDAEVQKALRAAIDAVVALQNVIAAVKAAKS